MFAIISPLNDSHFSEQTCRVSLICLRIFNCLLHVGGLFAPPPPQLRGTSTIPCATCPAAGAADSALWTPSLQRLWSPPACSRSTPLSSDLLTFRSAQAPIEWTATWLKVNSALQRHHLSWAREREKESQHLMSGVSLPLYLTAWGPWATSIKVWFKTCGYTVGYNFLKLLLHLCLPVSLQHVSPVRSGHIQAFYAWITETDRAKIAASESKLPRRTASPWSQHGIMAKPCHDHISSHYNRQWIISPNNF